MKLRRYFLYFKIIIFIILLFLSIVMVTGYFSKRVELYITQVTSLEASNMIAKSINESVLPYVDMDNLIKVNKSKDSEIESIFINTYQVNEIMAKTTESIKRNLSQIEKNEVLNNLKLPLGIIISEVFYNKNGPSINIALYPIGTVSTDVVTNYESYGINNTLLEISIEVVIKMTAIIPLREKEIVVRTMIPVVVQVIQGKVPTYYYNNTDSKYVPQPIDLN